MGVLSVAYSLSVLSVSLGRFKGLDGDRGETADLVRALGIAGDRATAGADFPLGLCFGRWSVSLSELLLLSFCSRFFADSARRLAVATALARFCFPALLSELSLLPPLTVVFVVLFGAGRTCFVLAEMGFIGCRLIPSSSLLSELSLLEESLLLLLLLLLLWVVAFFLRTGFFTTGSAVFLTTAFLSLMLLERFSRGTGVATFFG
mmetsp:Transcript_28226/g.59061  ORF Transcript_28226/g.59061 Transcript_28226/m.59061 type:complete len:205 (-) Transcript_28226:1927-2541(-)